MVSFVEPRFEGRAESGRMDYTNSPTMDSGEEANVTLLLRELRDGCSGADSRLFSAVYAHLKILARCYLRRERPDHTLAPTELVHEAYLRIGRNSWDWTDRAHFFRVAARAMRRILVDHARTRKAQKNGSGGRNLTINEVLDLITPPSIDNVVEVDELLTRLSAIDCRQAQVVELRVFAGLSVEESAEALGRSPRTVKRDWRFARAWLIKEVSLNGKSCPKIGGVD